MLRASRNLHVSRNKVRNVINDLKKFNFSNSWFVTNNAGEDRIKKLQEEVRQIKSSKWDRTFTTTPTTSYSLLHRYMPNHFYYRELSIQKMFKENEDNEKQLKSINRLKSNYHRHRFQDRFTNKPAICLINKDYLQSPAYLQIQDHLVATDEKKERLYEQSKDAADQKGRKYH